ncbi:hypothetical protein PHSY_002278 [Pseudozyma hubeiensis SY62]|uniref:Uncharacterized protein n=1 Tax=Pseudozyma hubeiensis (strain SY62) TaxID=1305764 RepID=R9P9D3_PSEHS|nr:hypothetical protein PHSY_002278 [Pseudozyma hubeiensis SY62]GAC94705.1 hypothetical protein PHSY_002278 [Pseudozyma hubeiensis SY62]
MCIAANLHTNAEVGLANSTKIACSSPTLASLANWPANQNRTRLDCTPNRPFLVDFAHRLAIIIASDTTAVMARGSAKKTASGNTFLLTLLRNGFLATNTIYLLVRFWLFRSSVSKRIVFGYVASEAIAVALWLTLQSMAAQGNDLQQSGLTQYMFDVIYVTWFVQLASLVWSKFWYLYLIIPGYAAYVIYQKILLPYLFRGQSPFASIQRLLGGSSNGGAAGADANAQQQPGEAVSKRQQKLQARAAKGDPRVQVRKR